nr:MAG TPA: hypothetical protein [Caudoviricetes sp.]
MHICAECRPARCLLSGYPVAHRRLKGLPLITIYRHNQLFLLSQPDE